jgi:hypothetical protein
LQHVKRRASKIAVSQAVNSEWVNMIKTINGALSACLHCSLSTYKNVITVSVSFAHALNLEAYWMIYLFLFTALSVIRLTTAPMPSHGPLPCPASKYCQIVPDGLLANRTQTCFYIDLLG